MKKILNAAVTTGICGFFFIGLTGILSAQVKLPILPDSLFTTYYQQRYSFFESMSLSKGDIVFLGNSITDGAEWSELFADNHMKNRGISGDISAGVLHRLGEVVKRKPSKVFFPV